MVKHIRHPTRVGEGFRRLAALPPDVYRTDLIGVSGTAHPAGVGEAGPHIAGSTVEDGGGNGGEGVGGMRAIIADALPLNGSGSQGEGSGGG